MCGDWGFSPGRVPPSPPPHLPLLRYTVGPAIRDPGRVLVTAIALSGDPSHTNTSLTTPQQIVYHSLTIYLLYDPRHCNDKERPTYRTRLSISLLSPSSYPFLPRNNKKPSVQILDTVAMDAPQTCLSLADTRTLQCRKRGRCIFPERTIKAVSWRRAQSFAIPNCVRRMPADPTKCGTIVPGDCKGGKKERKAVRGQGSTCFYAAIILGLWKRQTRNWREYHTLVRVAP
ncbi:hypothetical protein HOY80DRAFT_444154 [Tuber brumale]|nr:hypothetical protein HOY80DRAFT_444154 [Tuber brumale]